MNEALRRSAAHVLVTDVDAPLLSDAAAHHVFRVLRVRDGETVTVTDGAGAWRACTAVGGDAIEPTSPVERVAAPVRRRTIAVAIPKQDRPDWIVQKATELGLDRIVFLHAERSVVRWDTARAARHLEKLRRVAAEAAMQSRRVWLPSVEGPLAAADVLPAAVAAEPGGAPWDPALDVVAVGPEGGWSAAEIATAAGTVGLGDTVLRVETAAVAACTLMVLGGPRRPVDDGPERISQHERPIVR